ncbi:hypothetical protein CONLIGDRAFT_470450 [Coniochaeta ligniaria NRRL 30616]|uniref:Uncharacterized protein n=1 Tax=Coniochaeta ligniaria NRRL 30616 TaxID=1408157 RepID=A0A1J7IG44_9PEZI|nr:hypothetical protein CONLIGDRAFT_470450 [Coniochaeta ligniaria NRRL 30616]
MPPTWQTLPYSPQMPGAAPSCLPDNMPKDAPLNKHINTPIPYSDHAPNANMPPAQCPSEKNKHIPSPPYLTVASHLPPPLTSHTYIHITNTRPTLVIKPGTAPYPQATP